MCRNFYLFISPKRARFLSNSSWQVLLESTFRFKTECVNHNVSSSQFIQRLFISLAMLTLLLGFFLSVFNAAADVSCGGHFSESCAACPQGNGAAWCNGDCMWEDNSCVDEPTVYNNCGTGEGNLPPNVECQGGCGDDGVATTSTCVTDGIDSTCDFMPEDRACRYKLTGDDARSASVHLNFNRPASVHSPAWWINRVVPISLADVTYLATNGNSFGYGGVQLATSANPFEGRVLFSIWDQGCDTDTDPDCDPSLLASTVACGEGVTCEGFGGEGTGRKSQFSSSELPKVGSECELFATKVARLKSQEKNYLFSQLKANFVFRRFHGYTGRPYWDRSRAVYRLFF